MIGRVDKPRVGLLITALLEDDWNKTGYLRPKAQEAVAGYIAALASIAEVVCPGLVETEEQAVAADLAFKNADVEAVVFAELAYTQSLVPLRCPRGLPVIPRTRIAVSSNGEVMRWLTF